MFSLALSCLDARIHQCNGTAIITITIALLQLHLQLHLHYYNYTATITLSIQLSNALIWTTQSNTITNKAKKYSGLSGEM